MVQERGARSQPIVRRKTFSAPYPGLPLVRNTLYIPRLFGGGPYRAYMRSYIWGFSYTNAYMWPFSTVQDCPDAIRTVRNDSSACKFL